ncbi:MAG TPA: hypothetical protein VLB50_00445 [Ignavibacteriaceae bacterium]|nr:hypothetical protein [Ignavibacteriaceae bacterium]
MQLLNPKIFPILLLSLISLNCYRDQPSFYNINKIQSLNLIYPRGGETFKSDQIIPVSWESANINSDLKIGLIDGTMQIYSVGNIPDSGGYSLKIPSSAAPSKNYKLIIESMKNPEVHDGTKYNFEIIPVAAGDWYYSNVNEVAGLEISLHLASYINDSFIGDGTFYFKYISHGKPAGYESYVTASGVFSYPQIGIQLKGDDDRHFDISGQMIGSGEIKCRITGWIDESFGTIDDSLTLSRQ